MDLNERFNVLAQGAMVAQKNGALTLDEAVEVKKHIETIQKGENLKDSLGYLANVCNETQKKGIYTLQDAHFLFMAIDGLDDEINKFVMESIKQQEEAQKKGNQEIKAEVKDVHAPAPETEEVAKKTKKKGK